MNMILDDNFITELLKKHTKITTISSSANRARSTFRTAFSLGAHRGSSDHPGADGEDVGADVADADGLGEAVLEDGDVLVRALGAQKTAAVSTKEGGKEWFVMIFEHILVFD